MMLGISGATAEQATSLKELLLTPGELNAAHSDLKGKCDACHAEFTRASQDRLCADCHKEIDRDIQTHERYHGGVYRLRKDASCGDCHTEHRGKSAEITSFDTDLFDHSRAAFDLSGRHAIAVCQACHNEQNRKKNEKDGLWRIEHHQCNDCHEDPHDKALGETCGDCHDAENWRAGRFDHGQTDFVLTGVHVHTACNACHQDMKFEAPGACKDCHAPADRHRGAMGLECSKCHGTSGWDETQFDHGKTRFALHGRHADIACELCHNAPGIDLNALFRGDDPVQGICLACHRSNDIHEGAYGKRCLDCHSQQRWSDARFDHDRHTSFKLEGRHEALACVACHEPATPVSHTDKRYTCVDCHDEDDVHRGALGEQCGDCHLVKNAWQDTFFDHDFTNFPLTGLHRIQTCDACHLDKRFETVGGTCEQCHASGESHKGVFVEQCQSCHNTRDWNAWRFDHAATDFPLVDAHENLECTACHKADLNDPVNLSNACVACHGKDDIHNGGFGVRCDNCHTQTSFSDRRLLRGASR